MKRLASTVIALCMLLCTCAYAESRLNVEGSGTVYMQADQVYVTLGVRLNGEDISDLQKQANETISGIYKALEDAGLDAKMISTSNIYIYPVYDYSEETEEIVGYSINHMLSIHTGDTDKIGTYIDAAFAAGANAFESIDFTVKDDSKARKQALELAVADAQQKAEVIASAAGKMLGEIEVISEGSADNYFSDSYNNKIEFEEAPATADGTTVRASQVCVSANVQITYTLK